MNDFEKIVQEELIQALVGIQDACEPKEFYGQLEQGLAEDLVYEAIDFIHDRIREYIDQEALRISESALEKDKEE